MSRDLQNICSRTKQKTRVEILKFESKNKARVELEKKIRVEKERTLTSCVVYRCLHFTDMIRKHPFLLALRRWGRFARNSGSCNSTRMSFH